MNKKDRFVGSIIGLAVGDCVGVAVEFASPNSFSPVVDMTGGGPFGLKPGEWTDDTSMALCLAESILETNGFNERDQMDRYVRWYKKGYMSSKGECFDIGLTVQEALQTYIQTGEPFSGPEDPFKAGNGSIMRLTPVPLAWCHDMEKAIYYSGVSSRTTHQAQEAVDACHYLGALITGAVNGIPKDLLLSKNYVSFVERILGKKLSWRIKELGEGSYKDRMPPDINGRGYVVSSLEAALWGFYLGDSFVEGLLMVVNLGEDADTTGAIYGQLAGAYYGVAAIREDWRDKLVDRDMIVKTGEKLYDFHLSQVVYPHKGITSDYNTFFNDQDHQYYEISLNSRVEVFVNKQWEQGILKEAHRGTDYQWQVYFPQWRKTELLPRGTEVRLTGEGGHVTDGGTVTIIGGGKEYEQYRRNRRRQEVMKKLQLSTDRNK